MFSIWTPSIMHALYWSISKYYHTWSTEQKVYSQFVETGFFSETFVPKRLYRLLTLEQQRRTSGTRDLRLHRECSARAVSVLSGGACGTLEVPGWRSRWIFLSRRLCCFFVCLRICFTRRPVGWWLNVAKGEANSPLSREVVPALARREFFFLNSALRRPPKFRRTLRRQSDAVVSWQEAAGRRRIFLYSMGKEVGVKAQFCHLQTANRLDIVRPDVKSRAVPIYIKSLHTNVLTC